jgi:DNA-binding NarL/FixJ family response regulator
MRVRDSLIANSRNSIAMAKKILIVDDHPIVREGLAMQIATEPDLEVCGEAEDSAGALLQIDAIVPDLIVIDIALKNSNGFDLIRRVTEHFGDIYILVWSMYPENLYAERALRAGAQGYLNKAQPTSQVLEAIRRVLAGKIFISGDAADDLLHGVIGDRTSERSPINRYQIANWRRSNSWAKVDRRKALRPRCTLVAKRWKRIERG